MILFFNVKHVLISIEENNLIYDFHFFSLTASFVQTCLKSDPDFDDCSTEAVQKLFVALGPGKVLK